MVIERLINHVSYHYIESIITIIIIMYTTVIEQIIQLTVHNTYYTRLTEPVPDTSFWDVSVTDSVKRTT